MSYFIIMAGIAPLDEILLSYNIIIMLIFRSNLLIIKKITLILFLFKGFCFNSMKLFEGKIVEIIFKLPNFGLLHLAYCFI